MPVAYLLLGSNLGNRKKQIEEGKKNLESAGGVLLQVSALYETAAWGMLDQPSFLNQAIALDWPGTAQTLISAIHHAEAKASRLRRERWGPRTLDVDILFFGEEILDLDNLKVPHPALEQRRFALAPLTEIAPFLVHPLHGATVQQMLDGCRDELPVRRLAETAEQAEPPGASFATPELMSTLPYRYVAIEGNIGVGKTTLARAMAAHYGAKLVLEEFAHNDFLPKFYAEPQRYAFPLELSFLADRYKQLRELLAAPDLFSQNIISDFSFFKSSLFAKNNLDESEYELFQRLFNIILSQIPKPDLLIFLEAPIPVLQERIRLRGRPYEQDMPDAYLQSLHTTYQQFLKEHRVPTLIIDSTRFRPDETDLLAQLFQYLDESPVQRVRRFPG